jgi:hypothetical protein
VSKLGSDAAETGAKACLRSFGGATLVLMSDGSKKPIAEVRIGDKVIATDPETGEQVDRKVTHVWVHHDLLTDLVLTDGSVLVTTKDHLFWSVDDQKFERTDQLAEDERVLTADGRAVPVVGLMGASARDGLAYNLSINGVHTYHVGEDDILVHNACGIPLPRRVAGKTTPLTTSQAADLARYLGYSRTNYIVKGERVFQRGRSYIVQDTTAHNGGVWKIAGSVDALSSKATRTATTDALLNMMGR